MTSRATTAQAIPGATGTTYTLTAADLDATIRALVTASNAGGVAGATSVPSATVTVDPPSSTVAPVISGDLVDGATLTTDDGGWTGTQPLLYTYQWQRCDELGNNCINLPGATDPTYTLTGDDVGVVVRILVTAANDAGTASAALERQRPGRSHAAGQPRRADRHGRHPVRRDPHRSTTWATGPGRTR